jgi:hypothetical protein
MARIRHNHVAAKQQPSQRGRAAEQKPAPDTAARPSPGQPSGPGGGRAEQSPIFKGFADATSHVVKQAASILEEEIAAGILAARQIENKFLDATELRSEKPDEVLHRFRRDAHEVIDILLDIVTATTRNAGRMARRVISIRETARTAPEVSSTSVVAIADPIKAGATGEVSLLIENDGDTNAETFTLRPTDLINTAGDSIPARPVARGAGPDRRVAVP